MSAPAFQFYAQDFITGCIYLTNEEVGMYIKMLSKQWTDGKIPKARLELLIGMRWDMLSHELKSKFIDLGEFFFNERLEKERQKQTEKSEKAKNSAEKRWKKTPVKPVNTDKNKKNANASKTHQKRISENDAIMKYEYEDEIEVEKEKRKGGMEEKQKSEIPAENDFVSYAIEKEPHIDVGSVKLKYAAWVENGWKDGNGQPIKSWKSKLCQTLIHLPKNYPHGKSNNNSGNNASGKISGRESIASGITYQEFT